MGSFLNSLIVLCQKGEKIEYNQCDQKVFKDKSVLVIIYWIKSFILKELDVATVLVANRDKVLYLSSLCSSPSCIIFFNLSITTKVFKNTIQLPLPPLCCILFVLHTRGQRSFSQSLKTLVHLYLSMKQTTPKMLGHFSRVLVNLNMIQDLRNLIFVER